MPSQHLFGRSELDWLGGLEKLRSEGSPAIMATVTEVRGHAPREPGAKMVVGTKTAWGTIGGGNLEATVIERAREMIATGATRPETATFRLNEHAATEHGRQCCGGTASILIEPFLARPTVAIFGLGHVGRELARILSRLPIQLVLVDSRTDQLDNLFVTNLKEGIAGIKPMNSVVPDSALADLPMGAHVIIMTHDHAEDFLLCDAAIRREDLGSVGLIGSKTKWSRFQQRLQDEGHTLPVIERINCPVGLPEIKGKSPAIIAISVAARLLQQIGDVSYAG